MSGFYPAGTTEDDLNGWWAGPDEEWEAEFAEANSTDEPVLALLLDPSPLLLDGGESLLLDPSGLIEL